MSLVFSASNNPLNFYTYIAGSFTSAFTNAPKTGSRNCFLYVNSHLGAIRGISQVIRIHKMVQRHILRIQSSGIDSAITSHSSSLHGFVISIVGYYFCYLQTHTIYPQFSLAFLAKPAPKLCPFWCIVKINTR